MNLIGRIDSQVIDLELDIGTPTSRIACMAGIHVALMISKLAACGEGALSCRLAEADMAERGWLHWRTAR